MLKIPHSLRYFLLCAALVSALLVLGSPGAWAEIQIGGPIEIRILYDDSGSMYPGYAPPGRNGTPRLASGARFFYEYPEFRQWLGDFIARQTILDGSTVSFWIANSGAQFSPGDVRQVHRRVPLRDLNLSTALSNWPERRGDMTYLVESLDQVTRGFEGIVWLITDNIVETRRDEPNQEVLRFFEELKNKPRYRSVHLYKYPFHDPTSRQSAALAIYGIVVSSRDVNRDVLAHYDRKFRGDFRAAQGESSRRPLFQGQEHLKLKNLEIDALELEMEPSLEAHLEDDKNSQFKESQKVALRLQGTIRSHLTQHSVIGGRYSLIPASEFKPEEWARKDLGLESIPRDGFQVVRGELKEPIPPTGTRELDEMIPSLRPVKFSPSGLGAWLRLALNGARVQYEGRVQMQFEGVRVKLERERMAGIFGIDQASSVFDIQDNVKNISVMPSTAVVRFGLRSGEGRGVLFLLIAALLGLPFMGVVWVFTRRQSYRIHLSGSPARTVGLRRLGGHEILHEGTRLGRLARGLLGGHEFTPTEGSAAVTVTPTRHVDVFDVQIRGAGSHQLSIEPLESTGEPKPADAAGSRIRRPQPESAAAGSSPGPGGGRSPSPPTTPPGGAPTRPRPQIRRP